MWKVVIIIIVCKLKVYCERKKNSINNKLKLQDCVGLVKSEELVKCKNPWNCEAVADWCQKWDLTTQQ